MLQSKLAESLSNFRAIDSLLQEAFTGLRVRRWLHCLALPGADDRLTEKRSAGRPCAQQAGLAHNPRARLVDGLAHAASRGPPDH